VVKGAQQPRLKVLPAGRVHPRWREIREFVKALGVELDPWQWMVLRESLKRRASLWAAFTIGLCAPRQNGKNGILEPRQLISALLLDEPLQIHTAHLADTSKEGFRRLDDLIDANEWVSRQVRHIWRANGMEAIEFKGNRRIRFRTRTPGGGRGYAGARTVYFDEAMFLPEVSMGSILPVISASPDPQIWYLGSAVDQESMKEGTAFARVRERALAERSERLAYFEWSLESDSPESVDDLVAADPRSWAMTNPAFGRRITADYLKVEREELDSRTFAVERLGVGDWPDTTGESLFDLEQWRSLTDLRSRIEGAVTFAYDVPPDRSACTISVAGKRSDGLGHIEVVERRHGTRWLIDRMVELTKKHDTARVLCDSAGPAGSLVADLEGAGIEVYEVSGREHANACGLFYDAVQEGRIRHMGSTELYNAIRGASQRSLGDAWAWSRKNSAVDISPLVGCTLALWSALTYSKHVPLPLVGSV
jgi:hypothetical protein